MTNTSSDAETSFQQDVEVLSPSTLNLAIKSHYTLTIAILPKQVWRETPCICVKST